MKTKLLFTILGIFLLANLMGFSSTPSELPNEMSSEVQFANGKVLTVKIQGEELNSSIPGDAVYQKVSVYLPPGYDENGKRNYPVVYMLPDFNGSNEYWFQTFAKEKFPDILDNLIRSEKIEPMILVFPDANTKYGGAWYTNSSVSGNWEGFVCKDLVGYVDKNFKTLPFAVSRAIAGTGMGATGALKLAAKFPDVFSSVYALNALVDLKTLITDEFIWANNIETACNASVYPTDDKMANQLLSMAVAFAPNRHRTVVPGDLPRSANGEINETVLNKWLENDPLQMIQLYSENLKDLKSIVIDCSTDDAGVLLNSNYSEALTQKGINHSFQHFTGSESSDLLKRVTDFMLPGFSTQLSHALLTSNAKICLTHEDVLKTSLIADGAIFLTPVEESPDGFVTKSGNIQKYYVKANEEKEIALSEFPSGIYSLQGISTSGFKGAPVVFGLNGGTPQVKVCVTDYVTGKTLMSCGLKVDGVECIQPKDGVFCFDAEGNIELCIQKKGYGMLEKSVTIYTDVTINLSLVRNSFVQVVEKGIDMPIYEATVTVGKQAKLTGHDGYVTINNTPGEVSECRVFKPGYFTEVLTVDKPGASTIVKLTRKKADAGFILIGANGPKFGVYVSIDGVRNYSNEQGIVTFPDLDTRVEYIYSINDYNFKPVEGSFYLEKDEIIAVYLEPKENVMAFDKAGTANFGSITTASNDWNENNFKVYPNPARDAITVETDGREIYTVELTTQSGSSVYKTTMEGNRHRINLSNLSNGVYFVTVKSNNVHRTQRIMKL